MCGKELGDLAKGAFEIVTNPIGKIGQMTGDFVGGDVGKGIRDVSSVAGGFTSPFGVAGAVRTGSRMAGEGIGGETGRGLGEWGKSVGMGLDVANLGRGAIDLGRRGVDYLGSALKGNAPASSMSYPTPYSTNQYGLGSQGLVSSMPGSLEIPIFSPSVFDTVGDYAWQGLNKAADIYSNPLTQAALKYGEKEEMKQASQNTLNQQTAQNRQTQLASLLTGQGQGVIPYMGQGDNPLEVYAKYAGARTHPTYYTLPVNYPTMGG